MELREKTQSYKNALFQAHSFLTQYGSTEQLSAVTPSPIELEKEEAIKVALANASVLLNNALAGAFKLRLQVLRKAKQKQKIINILHFITASAFVSLLSKESPEVIKWTGAIIALVAGIIALTLPEGISDIEKNIDADTKRISKLSGQIASAQFRLSRPNSEIKDSFFEEISNLINECTQLAKELELDRIKRDTLTL